MLLPVAWPAATLVDVLSTEIYFSIVGTVADPAQAAILSVTLLALMLTVFLIQRQWVGKKNYATVTGKADSGRNAALNPVLRWTCYGIAIPWAMFTALIYALIALSDSALVERALQWGAERKSKSGGGDGPPSS